MESELHILFAILVVAPIAIGWALATGHRILEQDRRHEGGWTEVVYALPRGEAEPTEERGIANENRKPITDSRGASLA